MNIQAKHVVVYGFTSFHKSFSHITRFLILSLFLSHTLTIIPTNLPRLSFQWQSESIRRRTGEKGRKKIHFHILRNLSHSGYMQKRRRKILHSIYGIKQNKAKLSSLCSSYRNLCHIINYQILHVSFASPHSTPFYSRLGLGERLYYQKHLR